jgi:hypothetical protein
MMRRYYAEMPSDAQRTAEAYSRVVAKLGSLLGLGCGALFSVPLNQYTALVLVSLFFVVAFYLGREYRCCVEELLKQVSLLKLIRIFAPTWRFLLMTTILMGVGIGLAEWSFFAEYKHLLMGVILPSVAFDAYKILKSFFEAD